MCKKTGAIGGSVFSNPLPNPLLSAVKHPSTTIRIPSKVISGPFWPAESNRKLHLSIALLVVARLARTSPKSESKKFRQLFHPPVSPLSTTIRKAWRVGFRPIWCAESACVLRLSIGSMVVEIQAKSFQISEVKNSASFFHPPPSPLSTTIRKAWRVGFRPVWCAESACALSLSIGSMVVEIQAKTKNRGTQKCRHTWLNLHPSVQHYQTTIRKAWRVGFRPVWCAESRCGLRLSIGPMVVE